MLHQENGLSALIATARNAPSAGAVAADPFRALDHARAVGARVCDLLELIADALPNGVHPRAAQVAVRALRLHLPAQLALEERLSELARAESGRDAGIAEAWALSLAEHQIDRDAAAELAEALGEVGAEALAPAAAEALGLLIRSFVETQRRHAAWEAVVLLPAARRVWRDAGSDGGGEDVGGAILDWRHAAERMLLSEEPEGESAFAAADPSGAAALTPPSPP